jgi:hypothetical protein
LQMSDRMKLIRASGLVQYCFNRDGKRLLASNNAREDSKSRARWVLLQAILTDIV